MSLATEITGKYHSYKSTLSTNLNAIYDNVVALHKLYQPREDQFIRELALRFPSDLLTAFSTIPGISINITGVFCHQKPYVNFSNPITSHPCCNEIGDLLLIFKNIDSAGKIKYNSILYQAKKINVSVNCGDSQFLLYNCWPDFDFKSRWFRTQSINPICISPKLANNGGKYLIIDNMSTKPPCRFLTANSQCPIIWGPILAEEILEFLLFKQGKEFYDKSSSHDEWSKMIWAIIDYLNLPSKKQKRVSSYGVRLFYQCHMDDELPVVYGVELEKLVTDDSEFGISVVMIECNENR